MLTAFISVVLWELLIHANPLGGGASKPATSLPLHPHFHDVLAVIPPSALPVAAPPHPLDPNCEALVQRNDDPIVKIKHVAASGHPDFWVSLPPDEHYLKGWGARWLPGPLDTGMGYQNFVQHFTGLSKDSILLDIGAHVGVPALATAAGGYRVISFDPIPYNIRAIRQAICFNGFQSRHSVVEAAVGDTDGNLTIFLPKGHSDNSALSDKSATANLGDGIEKIPIPVRIITLDAWAAANLSPAEVALVHVVKVDVQGSETRVFKGAREFFKKLGGHAWVVGEHDGGLMGHSGFSQDNDMEEMKAQGFKLYDAYEGTEVDNDRARGLADIWYKKA